MKKSRVIVLVLAIGMSSIPTSAIGAALVYKGWLCFRDARVPVTYRTNLTGPVARVASLLFVLMGALTILAGIATAGFCFLYRLPQLLGK